jgi:hypothetical protein
MRSLLVRQSAPNVSVVQLVTWPTPPFVLLATLENTWIIAVYASPVEPTALSAFRGLTVLNAFQVM